jgi:hypothetical protein
VHLIYIDDSGDETCCLFSALSIPASEWRSCFERIREYRRALKRTDQILVQAEFHAWKFVSGRGRLGPAIVTKGRRCAIFKETLAFTATLPGLRCFNAFFPVGQEFVAFERLLNRINRNMQASSSHALLICDEGKEAAYTRLTRRMAVFNMIPSQYGRWEGGEAAKNIPIDRILEDPVFKPSRRSYFVQLADFAAYALLRRERQLPSKNRYGLHEAFNLLRPVLVTQATKYDPDGILRR